MDAGITKDNFGSISIVRNPVIASLLHRADYIERMGTGINRMNDAMEAAGLDAPLFQTEGYFFKVIYKRELLHHDIDNVGNVVNVINDVAKENQEKIINSSTISIPCKYPSGG